ncbi:MAG: FAD-binding oxidoreductase [Bacillota bacterium]
MRARDVAAAVLEARRTGRKLRLRGAASAGRDSFPASDTLWLGDLEGAPSLDVENLSVSLPASYRLGQLQAELLEHGLFYPPAMDLDSDQSVGSHLATGSCGPWRTGRGTARDWVLGLEVVTGQGDLIRTGSGVVKNVAGLDLTRLVIGSRGGLCAITGATLRLAPLPEATAVVAAEFAGPVAALGALPELLRSQLNPGALALDGSRLVVGLEGTRADLPRRTGWAEGVLKGAGGKLLLEGVARLKAPWGAPVSLPPGRVAVRAGLPAARGVEWVGALPGGAPVRGHAGSGIYHALLPADPSLLTSLADLAQRLGGYMLVESENPALLRRPAGVERLEALVGRAFDPDQIFIGGGKG